MNIIYFVKHAISEAFFNYKLYLNLIFPLDIILKQQKLRLF